MSVHRGPRKPQSYCPPTEEGLSNQAWTGVEWESGNETQEEGQG